MIILRNKDFSEYQKGVTKYDRTDRFKAMKDSDILAEKKRSNAGSYVKTGKAAVAGGVVGSAVGKLRLRLLVAKLRTGRRITLVAKVILIKIIKKLC